MGLQKVLSGLLPWNLWAKGICRSRKQGSCPCYFNRALSTFVNSVNIKHKLLSVHLPVTCDKWHQTDWFFLTTQYAFRSLEYPPSDEFGAHPSLGPSGLSRGELGNKINGGRACKTIIAKTIIITSMIYCCGSSVLLLPFCCHRKLTIDWNY